MRDYGKIHSTFWTGETGRLLRKEPDAQRLAAYLITAPTSNMIGLYYIPMTTICHEVGLTDKGASKALQSLSEGGFAYYDEPSGWVWVVQMARFELGPSLDAKDNRTKSVQKLVDAAAKSPFVNDFCKLYGERYHITTPSPFEAPSKPLRSQAQEQAQAQKQEQNSFAAASPLENEPRTEATPKPDPPGFLDFWLAYPLRNGKRVGRKATAELFAKLPPSEVAECIQAAKHYAASQQARDGFAKDPERFLKKDFWRDWTTPPEVVRVSAYVPIDSEEAAAWTPL